MVGVVNARPSASTDGRIGAGLRQRMPGLAWHARRTGLDGGRRRLAGDDRFETQIVVMASDSDAVSWLRLGGRFVFAPAMRQIRWRARTPAIPAPIATR